ncbi:MAG: heme-binding protein [Burkholderiaceae bacterium]
MADLTLDQANRIISGALAAARSMKIPPLAVVVLDAGGHLVAAQREDGASMFRVDVATGKAWAAVGMDASSRTLAERAKDNPNFFVALASTGQGRFLPQPGAVLIRAADGRIIGAAGASGATGDEDEAACMAGVKAAGLLSDPKAAG